jgi:hypothetical protein
MRSRPILYVMIPVLLACFMTAAGALGQEQQATQPNPSDNTVQFGLGLTMKYPYESFGDDYNTAYGLAGMLAYPFIPLLDLTASIGWNQFSEGDQDKSLDLWEFTGGMRFRMGVFFMSGEVGYYTKIEQTSFLPGLGLKFEHFEVALNVRAVDKGSWTGLRLGYYF